MDLEKLKAELADAKYAALTPDEILQALKEEVPIPPSPPAPTTQTKAQSLGIGDVSLTDIQSVKNPSKQMRSHPEIPGSYYINPTDQDVVAGKVVVPAFAVMFDGKIPAQPIFKSEAEAQAWVDDYYAARPSIEVV